jgi:hypothetical protein
MPADVTGAVMALPARNTWPDEGSRNPATSDRIVLLPQPLGPTMDTNWPASKSKDTLRSASTPPCLPNHMDTLSRTTDAGALAMRQYPPMGSGSDVRREATKIHSRSATAAYKSKPSNVSAISAENDSSESSDAEADKS